MKIKYQAEGHETFISIQLDDDTSIEDNVSAVARLLRAVGFAEQTIVYGMIRYADEKTPAQPGIISFDFEENN
jgi:hypothetical protein